LDVRLLQEIVRGVRMDARPVRIQTLSELKQYCWRVASAVGLVSARLFGCKGDDAKVYAENLGLALQLTNILRDTAEDAALDRIYHPIEELALFGVSAEDLFEARETPALRAYFEYQAGRAWAFFRAAERALPDAERSRLMTAEIMRAIYETLLRRMQRAGFRVFQKRYSLPKWQKAGLAMEVVLKSTLSPRRRWQRRPTETTEATSR